MEPPLSGRCACGEVRYQLTSRPLFVHACHCTECRRLTGAAFAVNAMIETDRVERLAGAPIPVAVTGTSGKPQTILRCPRCQTALWSHYPGAGAAIAFVRVGTLDEAESVAPDIHIFTSTRLPWIALSQDIPAVEEFYRAADYWPPASLARRSAIRSGKGS